MSIRFEQVTFTYPGTKDAAVRDVSFRAERGEIVVLTGSLGAGCSTLIHLAAGFAPRLTGGEVRGRVRTLGEDPTTAAGWGAIAGRVAVLLPTPWTQLSGMTFTVSDEVAFGPANLGWDRARVRAAARDAMERVGVMPLAARDPATLSGGELQRVILASLIAMEPEILLLDEPVVELDPESAETVYAMLPALAERATVVLATADPDQAAGVADRVVVLEAGRVLADGAAAAVLGDPVVVDAGAGTSIAALCQAAGCTPPFPVSLDAALHRLR